MYLRTLYITFLAFLFLAMMPWKAIAQVKQANREYLFVDTLKAAEDEEEDTSNPEILADEEEYFDPTDSLQMAALEAMDSLSRATILNYVPKVDMDILADRLQCIEGEMPLYLNKKVASFIDYFVVRNRNYIQTMLERKDYYFPLFERKLAEYNLPNELKYLAIVESGLNHAAISKSGAVGLWQFMGPTGRDMNLRQDFYFDYRLSPEEATEAACKYLKMLYRQFNDWELVLAAYNCGLGKIKNVVKRTGKKHFWEIYDALPMETRAYVPQFVAVSYAMNYAKEHNIRANIDSTLYDFDTDTIHLNRCIAFDKLAHHTGIHPSILKLKNPALRRHASPHNESYVCYVPSEIKAKLKSNPLILDSATVPIEVAAMAYKNPSLTRKVSKNLKINQNKLLAKSHKIKKGETLLSLAKTYKVSVSEIKSWNHIRNGKIAIGKKLIVYVPAPAKKPTPDSKTELLASSKTEIIEQSPTVQKIKDSAPVDTTTTIDVTTKVSIEKKLKGSINTPTQETSSIKGIVYEVQAGDTLWAISKKYAGLTIEKIIKMNGLKERKITPGQKLIVG